MASLENEILRMLESKDNYQTYREHTPDDIFSPIGRQLLKYVDEYWTAYGDSVDTLDWEDMPSLLSSFAPHDPNLAAMQQMAKVTAGVGGVAIARDVLDRAVERDLTEQVYSSVEEALTKGKAVDVPHLSALVERLESHKLDDLSAADHEVSVDIEDVLKNSHVSDDGLPFSLPCLQQGAGPLRPGDTVFVPARPETGKTTFLVNQATYMMEHSKATNALILSNEEDGNRVMIRLYQAALNMTTKEILDDPAGARSKYEAKYGSIDRIRVIHASPLHRRDVERAIERYNPDLILFNMLSKIRGFGNKNAEDVDVLSAQALWMRELANGYGAAAMTAWQAGGSAHGKPWIEQDDMYGSKTGVPAEADLIIGIGKAVDSTGTSSIPENHRYIHLSKNKLMGDSKTVEALRHGYFNAVYIDAERGRFYE